MNRKLMMLTGLAVVGIAVIMFFFFRTGAAQEEQPSAGQAPEADPQRLMIPRWFLRSLTLDGREVPIAPDQQEITLQFEEGTKANGTASCNSFFTEYQAGEDGALSFGPIGATKMWCENISVENDYFQALAQVERFNTADYKLTLTSADGRTTLVFEMPPK